MEWMVVVVDGPVVAEVSIFQRAGEGGRQR